MLAPPFGVASQWSGHPPDLTSNPTASLLMDGLALLVTGFLNVFITSTKASHLTRFSFIVTPGIKSGRFETEILTVVDKDTALEKNNLAGHGFETKHECISGLKLQVVSCKKFLLFIFRSPARLDAPLQLPPPPAEPVAGRCGGRWVLGVTLYCAV